MLSVVKQDKKPEFCVITPLKPGDKISRDTKISVKRNDKPFIWATYESENNVARNFKLGLQELEKYVKLPLYTIKLDNDTIWNRNTLDYMVDCLNEQSIRSDYKIAYCYVSFEYRGSINQKFPAIDFNIAKLKNMNYISSNSMFVTEVLEKVELVTDDKYKRLLDWAYYLKLLNSGYYGTPCRKGYFVAKASADSISAGGAQDFQVKYKRVVEDFVEGK